ncbi:MAG: hypothetical protein BGO89_13375 [Candidatus Kapaibacterium thiocyanatum]|uniref:Uncharacterized protein n=1 Tax=Candidatus Kapaibacterium thiocyanatum TaxID=1895771 RepID=A0A1M3KVB0_9BACT|nr:MAG: hypothetical protein BGO89_13375 ['Candidatus Kapabacteria' thiocyanatum]
MTKEEMQRKFDRRGHQVAPIPNAADGAWARWSRVSCSVTAPIIGCEPPAGGQQNKTVGPQDCGWNICDGHRMFAPFVESDNHIIKRGGCRKANRVGIYSFLLLVKDE